MALTTMDTNTALVVIDLQKGTVGLQTVHPVREVVQRAASLATAFRRHGLPVVLVNVAGRAPGRTEAGLPGFSPPPDWTELVAELQPQSDDHRVTKLRWGAFHGTSLDADRNASVSPRSYWPVSRQASASNRPHARPTNTAITWFSQPMR